MSHSAPLAHTIVRPVTAILAALALAPAASAAAVLEVYEDTLTTYLPASATAIQDIRPLAIQRAVHLDGTLVAGSTFDIQINGNPFGSRWSGKRFLGDVRLDIGAYMPTDIDISLPATVPWVIGRTYNGRQQTSGGSARHSDGYQGKDWFQTSQPEIVLYEAPDHPENDVLYIHLGAERYIELERLDDGGDPPNAADVFKAVNGAGGVAEFVAGATDEPDVYVYYSLDGREMWFFGFDGDAGAAAGQIWKIVGPDGDMAYVGDDTTGSTAIANGYNASGYITKAYDDVRRFSYTYTDVNGTDRLTQVKAEIDSGSWVEVARVDYEYDSSGYLRIVRKTLPLSESGLSIEKDRFYAYNGSGQIELVLGEEGCRNYDYNGAGDSAFDDDFETASVATLKPYAELYLEYDGSKRIDSMFTNGACGCSGGSGAGTIDLTYGSVSGFSGNSGYDQEPYTYTRLEKPEGEWGLLMFDELGGPETFVQSTMKPLDSLVSTDMTWITYVERYATSGSNPGGSIKYITSPSAHGAWNNTTGAFTTDLSAVANEELFPYSSGNTLDGQPKILSVFQGINTLASQTATATTATVTIGSGTTVDLVRPVVDTVTDFMGEDTDHAPTFYSGTVQLKKDVVTHPAVLKADYGSGSSLTTARYFRQDGSLAFVESTDGIFDYTKVEHGLVTERRRDAKLDGAFPTGDDPNGTWLISENGYGLDLTTSFTHDNQGRLSTTVLPSGRTTATHYTKLADGRLVTLSSPKKSGSTYYSPVSYIVTNYAGKVEAQGTIAFSGGSTTTAPENWINDGSADLIAAVATGSLERLTTSLYNEAGTRVEEKRAYFAMPASGVGDSTDNYDPTFFGYNDAGQLWRIKDATGTIDRREFDPINRLIGRYAGTNDSSFTGGESSGTDNMVQIELLEYPTDGNGEGNREHVVIKRTLYVVDGTTDQRVYEYEYGPRNEKIYTKGPQAPFEVLKYDEQKRVVARALYSSSSGLSASTNPLTNATNRIALSETGYDAMGRVSAETRWMVDPSDGSLPDYLTRETWYGPDGNAAKIKGDQVIKRFYDRVGRLITECILASDDDETNPANAGFYTDQTEDVDGDKVLQETQYYLESTTGNRLAEVTISRFYDDTTFTGSLDPDTDHSSVDQTGSTFGADKINGRVQIVATCFDGLDRPEHRALVGTNGGSDFDRDTFSTPPTRSDTLLVTSTTYNDDGSLKEITDPAGIVTRYEYDDLGRTTKQSENYVDGTPGGGANDDEDRVIKYEYTDGLKTKYIADMPSGQSDQTTTYTYAATTSNGSAFFSNRLLTEIEYPDSGGASDVVSIGYNAQGQLIYIEDQAGNVVQTEYNTAGQRTARRVTTLATGFDGAVRAIRTAYDNGLVSTVTQYDDASSTSSGDVVDQVQFSWDGWRELEHLDHDFNGEIGTDYWRVTYVREAADGGRNALRVTQEKLLYAGSTEKQKIEYTYGTSGSMNDDLSRVTTVSKYASGSPVTLASYDYLGQSLVGVNLVEPSDTVSKRYYGSTTGSYPSLDRFDRVVSDVWSKDVSGGPIDFFDQDRTLNRMGNVTLIEDNVYAGRDAEYVHDDLNRLIEVNEGTWSGSAITSQTRQEVWELDQAGNWDVNKLDLNGDLDYSDTGEFNVSGTFNDANEQTARGGATLSWDAMGNLADDGASYKFEFDPFGRLRKVTDQSDILVAEFRYNGLNEMISVQFDANGNGTVDQVDSNNDPSSYLIYGKDWQVIGICRTIDDGAGKEAGEYLAKCDDDPKELYVHHAAGLDGKGGASYIDDLILRDADMDGGSGWFDASDGALEQRLYTCQDAHANVIALLDVTGARVEGARYFAYGMPFGLPRSDCDGDGDVDIFDVGIKNAAYGTSVGDPGYNVRADIDLDGDVDATDSGIVSGDFGQTLGRGALTRDPTLSGGVGNRFGYAGYMWNDSTVQYQARQRWVDPLKGRPSTRDRSNRDGMSLYEFVRSQPIVRLDPSGLISLQPIGSPGGVDPNPHDVTCSQYAQLPDDGGEVSSGCGNGPPSSGGDPKFPNCDSGCNASKFSAPCGQYRLDRQETGEDCNKCRDRTQQQWKEMCWKCSSNNWTKDSCLSGQCPKCCDPSEPMDPGTYVEDCDVPCPEAPKCIIKMKLHIDHISNGKSCSGTCGS